MGTIDPVLARKVKSYRWVSLITLWCVYFFVYFDRVAPAVVAPELVKEFSISAASLGVLAGAYFYPYALMQIPSGLLSDFIGPRKAVTIFFTIAGVGTLIFGLSESFGMAIFGRVLMGMGVAVVYLPIMKIQAAWWKPQDFAMLTGILLTIGNLGALGAAGPLAALVDATGWRTSFYLLAGVTVILAAATYILVRNKPQDMGLPSIQEVENFSAPGMDAKLRPGQALKYAIFNRNFPLLGLYIGLMYGPFMAFQGLWAIPYMMDVLNLAKVDAGWAISFWAIGMVIGCPIWGIISDKIIKARRPVIVIGGVLHTIGWVYIAMNPAGWSMVTISIFCTYMGATGGSYVVSHAQMGESVPRAVVATAIGAFNVFSFVYGSFLQPWVGKILDSYGRDAMGKFPVEAYTIAFWIFAVGLAIATIGVLFTRETYIKKS